ncbi:MAG: signal peptidase I [Firmicutes bacterium]|nr:signal peptidase I [Bacillota bacterium]
MQTKSEVREIIESLAIAVLIVTFVTVFIGRFCRVKGRSMEPTLHTGEWLWTDKLGYTFGPIQRGDIVVLKYRDTKEKYVKRVIGLPGDSIEIKDRAVYVNGARLKEPYVKEPPLGDFKLTEVPPNSYFVMGDNRNQSDDSRGSVGPVPREKIEGRAVIRIWPIWRLRIFFRPKIEEIYDFVAPPYEYQNRAPENDREVGMRLSSPSATDFRRGGSF